MRRLDGPPVALPAKPGYPPIRKPQVSGREEVVPPFGVVVRVVRPHHPVHDVAPPLGERAGVATANGPTRLRILAGAALVPPLVVVELALGIGLLARLEVLLAGGRRRVVALRGHLGAPPALEAEVHIGNR